MKQKGREVSLISAETAISGPVPILFAATTETAVRFIEFFAANIRNPNTRRAYYHAACRFSVWCESRELRELASVRTLHIAAYVEQLGHQLSRPSVKQHLAAIRMLFDWLVTGQVVPSNPAASVRGPRHVVQKGSTPVLSVEEARELIDSIETSTIVGLRDRALLALLTYTFARVNAAVAMRVEDYYMQGRRGWVRLHEKGGKLHDVPAHHKLEDCLEAYIQAAGIAHSRKAPLFRSLRGRTGELTERPLDQAAVYRMIQRRAQAAGIRTEIGCHSFRATGITAYLQNGGRLEIAQQMANHASARTTKLYDRRGDAIALDEVERIGI